MANTAFKPRLIELLLQMHARQQELVRDLSDQQREASGTPEHWSAKDLIAHITAWQQIIFNNYTHTLDHLSRFFLEHNDQPRADLIQENIAEELSQLDDRPTWQGNTRYNLACFYAITGQPAKAIPLPREALQLNPSLADWSKQDSDLNSLRQNPDYRALLRINVT